MTDDTARVRLRYTGSDEVLFAGSVHASPHSVKGGEEVEVDAWAAESMLAEGPFEPADEGQAAAVDALQLKGKALDEALVDAGLPTGGAADEKRQRLADHLAGNDDPDGDPGNDDPDGDQPDENEEQ